MISTRFNRHMKAYQAREAHVHETDISRASASYAAFMLGISNMRRRKLRTGLTLLTLVLLTFTVLSFTSFNTQIRYMAFAMDHEGNLRRGADPRPQLECAESPDARLRPFPFCHRGGGCTAELVCRF